MPDVSIALPLKFVIAKHLVDACYLLILLCTSVGHRYGRLSSL